MKAVDYKKPVSTIPEGVWESSRPKGKNDQDQQCTRTTDLQGNGYPVSEQNSFSVDVRQVSKHSDE